jgi:hypothetical protein
MGADGESRFAVPESGQFKGLCASTYEGPGNLLFVRHYDYSSHLETLWTVRLPESQP